VRVVGTRSGPCDVLDVVGVESPAPAVLQTCGSPAPGCPLRLRSAPGGLALHALFASLDADFLPVNPVQGTFLLGAPYVLVASGSTSTFQPEGAAFDLRIPADPSLVGLSLFMQSVRRDILPSFPGGDGSAVGPLRFSNAVCLTIEDGASPCEGPGC